MPKHYHVYRRTNIGGQTGRRAGKKYLVYKCIKTGCTHYVTPELVVGRIAECSRCHEPFEVDRLAAKRTLIHCVDCTKRKKEPMESTLEFIKELENDLKG